jgi:hypothetical protein
MASTYSTNLALELIGTGEQSGTWGTTTNTNLGTLLEQAISGYVTQAITDGSGANTTITIPNGATGVARNMFIEMTGALSFSTTSLIVPANKKMYFVFNNTSGGFAVTVKVSGQTGILVPNGKKVVLTCNGTDIVEAHTAIVGNATMGGTLGVTGATTLSSTLAVTGITTVAAGTVALPSITTSGDTNTGIYFPAADTVAVSTGGTERMRIDSAGKVLVGTTTDTGVILQVGADATAQTAATIPTVRLTNLDTAVIANDIVGSFEFYSVDASAPNVVTGFMRNVAEDAGVNYALTFGLDASTERMRIDSSGNVGIGTTAPSKKLEIYTSAVSLQIESVVRNDMSGAGVAAIGFNVSSSLAVEATSTKAGIGLVRSAAFGGGSLCFYNNNSGAAGDFTTADEKMRIDTSGNVGIGTTAPAARIDITQNQAALSYLLDTSNTTNGGSSIWRMITRNIANSGTTSVDFYKPTGSGFSLLNYDTHASNFTAFGIGGSERMRIDSSGNLLVGTTNALAKLTLSWPSASQQGFVLQAADVSFAGSPIIFYNSASGISGYIGQTTSTISYNTSSDYRLKEAIAPMTGALAKVALLKPCTYKWKVDGSDGQGFIAHELQVVVPECIAGEKDALNEDGSIKPQGIDTSFLVATLTAAIQELKAIIDTQATRIAALEAKA